MTNKEEVKDLLFIYKMKCFSLSYCCDDTEVEDGLKDDLDKIEQRVLELVED